MLPPTPEFVTLLNSLANSLMAQKRYVEAEPLLREAIQIAEKTLGREHLSLARVIANLTDVYFAQNNHIEAAPLWGRSLQITQDQFEHEFTYMNEKGRLSLLETAAVTIAGYSSFWFASREDEPAATGKMYDLALWQKGLVANSMVSLRARIAETGVSSSSPRGTTSMPSRPSRPTRLPISSSPSNRSGCRLR